MFLQGVKGLLEAAGYTVYNPTLPYHFPNDTWNINDGLVTIQQYVDVYKGVSTPARSDCALQLLTYLRQSASTPSQAALQSPLFAEVHGGYCQLSLAQLAHCLDMEQPWPV